MPVAFGFSVGDFIAAANLIHKVIKSLRASDGSASEYQHFVVELEALGRALNHVSALEPSASNINHVNAIRGLALSCRFPLQDFLDKIEKYEPSMGSFAPKKMLHGARHKLQWAIFVADEVRNLRVLIAAKVVSINLLLSIHASQTMSELHSQDRDKSSYLLTEVSRIRKGMDLYRSEVQLMTHSAAEKSQNALQMIDSKIDVLSNDANSQLGDLASSAKSIQTSVVGLQDMWKQVMEFITTFPKELRELLQKILAMNSTMYALLLQSQGSIKASPTWQLESNIRFEDALGRSRELPYEWFRHWEASDVFDGLLRAEFKDKPGESKVLDGHYHIMDVNRPNLSIAKNKWEQTVFPGSSLSMSMIIAHIRWQAGMCPRPSCDANCTKENASGSMTICEKCGLRYHTYGDDIGDNFQRLTVLNDEDDIAITQAKQDQELFGDRPKPLDPEEAWNTNTDAPGAATKRIRDEGNIENSHKTAKLDLFAPLLADLEDITALSLTTKTETPLPESGSESHENTPTPLLRWLEQTVPPLMPLASAATPSIEESNHIRDLEMNDLEVFRKIHISRSSDRSDAPVVRPEFEGIEDLEPGSRIYYRNILDQFPDIPLYLARRLADANRKRAASIRCLEIGTDEGPIMPASEEISPESSLGTFEDELSSPKPEMSFKPTTSEPLSQEDKKVAEALSKLYWSQESHPYASSDQSNSSTSNDSLQRPSFTRFSPNSNDSLQLPSCTRVSSLSMPATVDGRERNVFLPPPPVELGTAETFLCDICGKNVQVLERRAWQKHVLEDLKPYVCTFEGCETPDKTYVTRLAFANHERSRHSPIIGYQCEECSGTFATKEQMRNHLKKCNKNRLFSYRKFNVITGRMKARNCAFCTQPIAAGLEAFASHVGQHLEDISISILARQRQEWKFYEESATMSSSSSHDRRHDPRLVSKLEESATMSSSSSDDQSHDRRHGRRLVSKLEEAAKNGDIDSLKRTMRRVSDRKLQSCSALNMAAQSGHHAAVWLLLKRGAKGDQWSWHSYGTALHEASAIGHLQIVRLLLDTKLYPNSLGRKNVTALELAVGAGHQSVAEELLKSGAMLLPTSRGRVSQHFYDVVKAGPSELSKILLNHSQGHALAQKLLAVAIKEGDDNFAKSLVQQHVTGALEDALQLAVLSGRTSVVSSLLEAGAKPSRKDLIDSTRFGDTEMVRTLFPWVLKSHSVDTILCGAIDVGALEIVHMIITRGLLSLQEAINMARNHYSGSENLLSQAVQGEHVALAKLLLDNQIFEVNFRGFKRRPALSRAAQRGHLAMVDLLLNSGQMIDINSKDEQGRTVLSWAAGSGDLGVVKRVLLVDGVEVDLKDNYGRTPLSHAAQSGNLAVVQLLIETAKSDVKTKDQLERTLLGCAAEEGHAAVASYLLTVGDFDVNSKDLSGRSPLWVAAWKGHLDVVTLLVEKGGADLTSADCYGRSASRLARENGHHHVAHYLDAKMKN